MTYQRWTLRTENTSYTVRLSPDGPWAELDAWGPLGVEDGPSALDWSRRTHFITPTDAAPAEYLPYGLRPFTGPELVASRPDGEDRGVWWEFTGAETDEGALRLAFHDEQLGLRTVLHYETVPGTDVILRRTEFTATDELRLERLDSAAVNIPVTGVARLTYLTGQWSQEFQRTQLDLPRGTFTIGSLQGAPGHAYAPWLAVQDGESQAVYGIALAWPGNWHITAEAEPGGAVRVRAGRVPHEGAVILAPGETLTTPNSPAPSARRASTDSPASGTATNDTSPASACTAPARSSTTPGKPPASTSTRPRNWSWRRQPPTSGPSCSSWTTAGSPDAPTTPGDWGTGGPTWPPSRRDSTNSSRT